MNSLNVWKYECWNWGHVSYFANLLFGKKKSWFQYFHFLSALRMYSRTSLGFSLDFFVFSFERFVSMSGNSFTYIKHTHPQNSQRFMNQWQIHYCSCAWPCVTSKGFDRVIQYLDSWFDTVIQYLNSWFDTVIQYLNSWLSFLH